jgi:hypothetical protein
VEPDFHLLVRVHVFVIFTETNLPAPFTNAFYLIVPQYGVCLLKQEKTTMIQ